MPSGRYRIVRKLGEGGMGRTYLVRDRKLGKYWAMKEWKEAEAGEEAFWREGAVLRNLEHSCFPRIVEIFRENGKRYLVMDWIQGVTLEEEIISHGSLPIPTAVRYAIQLCGALALLHEGEPKILHLDLKPSNIILTQEGVKLIDFGNALQAGTAGGKMMLCRERQAGTPGYVPPELLTDGIEAADERSDIYGLGAVLYAMLMGKSPGAGGEREGGLKAGFWKEGAEPVLPPGLRRVLTCALQEKKENRYASVEEMCLELQRVLEKENGRKRGKRMGFSFCLAGIGAAACIALATSTFPVGTEGARQRGSSPNTWNEAEADIGCPVIRQEKRTKKNKRYIRGMAEADKWGRLPYEGLLENFRERIEEEAMRAEKMLNAGLEFFEKKGRVKKTDH